MRARLRHLPRQIRPELEIEISRSPSLGYEPAGEAGIIRCLEHGWPTPLARWHYHDEYELHLIVATSGKAFVGDWIGQFQPGHRACQLLMESDSLITGIRYVVGFNTVANFNRRFLDIKGMTPREYRRQGESRFGIKH